ncbi:MAG: DMT family transporter [Clostridia bacterium]|nr:DMT family transporter [Clostridia bacterium]
MKRKQTVSSLMLLLTAVIWGTAFVAQGAVSSVLGAFTFNAVRSFVGAAFMVPIFFLFTKKGSEQAMRIANREGRLITVKAGVICGSLMFLGAFFQQYGITSYTAIYGTTAVGKAGFITTLYVILVPIFGMIFKKKVSLQIWISVLIAVIGLYLLCVKEGFSVDLPDLYVLVCAVAYSFYILAVDRYANRVNTFLFSTIQLFVCGLISAVCMFIFETVVWADILSMWFPIVYTGVFSSAIAFTLEAVAQKNTDPAISSLIFCLESVFAALAGWLILNETMTGNEVLGCGLMFIAVVLSQLPFNRLKRANR